MTGEYLLYATPAFPLHVKIDDDDDDDDDEMLNHRQNIVR